MKFDCDHCGKHYSSADDPVPGKVYRIRCKCGHDIVISMLPGSDHPVAVSTLPPAGASSTSIKAPAPAAPAPRPAAAPTRTTTSTPAAGASLVAPGPARPRVDTPDAQFSRTVMPGGAVGRPPAQAPAAPPVAPRQTAWSVPAVEPARKPIPVQSARPPIEFPPMDELPPELDLPEPPAPAPAPSPRRQQPPAPVQQQRPAPSLADTLFPDMGSARPTGPAIPAPSAARAQAPFPGHTTSGSFPAPVTLHGQTVTNMPAPGFPSPGFPPPGTPAAPSGAGIPAPPRAPIRSLPPDALAPLTDIGAESAAAIAAHRKQGGKGKRLPLIIGGAVAACAALGLGAFFALRPSEPPVQIAMAPPPAPRAPPAPAAPPPAAPVAPAPVAAPPPAPVAEAPKPPPPASAETAADRKKAERERLAQEKADKAKADREERAERDRGAREARERAAQEKADKAKADREARAERDRAAREERERAAQEKADKAKADREERAERERAAAERVATAKAALDKATADRAAAEKAKQVAAAAPPAPAEKRKGIDGKEVRAAIGRSQPAFDECVRAATGGPDAQYVGRQVDLYVEMSPTGSANDAFIDDDGLQASQLGKCIKRAAMKMSVSPYDGEPVPVRVPLRLGQK